MYLAQYAQTHLQRDSGSARTVSFNTSKVIRSVEDKKLITRLVGKTDKRQMHFALTPEGKSRITVIKTALPKFRPYCRRLFRERLSGLFMVIRPAVQYGHGTV